MRRFCATIFFTALMTSAHAQSMNAGDHSVSQSKPFIAREVARFNTPWAIGFLPDGRMLITEKPGQIFLVTQSGRKTAVSNVPSVAAEGQNGLLDIAASPNFAVSRDVYFTYSEPGASGSRLVLSRAKLATSGENASLEDAQVIWRQTPAGGGGQSGGIIAFDPSGKHLYLTVGDRMRPETAQDPDQARGKLLRLNLDGSTPVDNPHADQGGVRGETLTTGHRNPYGLAFAPDGRLWLHEMGPRGGDELNLIKVNGNYGWPLVSNGDNYSGKPIPRHSTRPEFIAPVLYWSPVIAPAGLTFYDGQMFPQWRGSALIGGLASTALVRVTFDTKGGAEETDRWDMEARIRDVAVAPDGAVWLIEDDSDGKLLRLTPGKS
jgi:aldose sugar dehydrogenase